MTDEEFARRFADLMATEAEADQERPMTDEEVELLQEIARRAESPQGRAQMLQIIRGIPPTFYPRRWSLEQLAEVLWMPPDEIRHEAEAGRLTGTHGPDGWRFGLADAYLFMFPDEPDEEGSPAR